MAQARPENPSIVSRLFSDWGVRAYLSRIFWDDYPTIREIDLAGATLDMNQLDKEIAAMDPLLPDSTDLSFNLLSQSLNDFKLNLKNQLMPVWKNIEKDVSKYCDAKMRIYEGNPAVGNPSEKKGIF